MERRGRDGVMFVPLRASAEEIEHDSWVGGRPGIVVPVPSSAGMVGSRCCRPLRAWPHSGVVSGEGAALLPGGSCWPGQ